jgi:hypothetical protein
VAGDGSRGVAACSSICGASRLAPRSAEAAAGGAPPLQGWWRDGGRCWGGDWVATAAGDDERGEWRRSIWLGKKQRGSIWLGKKQRGAFSRSASMGAALRVRIPVAH